MNSGASTPRDSSSAQPPPPPTDDDGPASDGETPAPSVHQLRNGPEDTSCEPSRHQALEPLQDRVLNVVVETF